jgi:hypothetical protein
MNPKTLFRGFATWLRKQPSKRLFFYVQGAHTSPIGCPLCNFLREEKLKDREFSVNPMEVDLPGSASVKLPKRLVEALRLARNITGEYHSYFTAGELKKAWAKTV